MSEAAHASDGLCDCRTHLAPQWGVAACGERCRQRAGCNGRYEHIARVLEGGKFDGLFFVDTLALMEFYDDSFAAVVQQWRADLHAGAAAAPGDDGARDRTDWAVRDDVHGFLSTVPYRAKLCDARSH